jgi:hypothetical protein
MTNVFLRVADDGHTGAKFIHREGHRGLLRYWRYTILATQLAGTDLEAQAIIQAPTPPAQVTVRTRMENVAINGVIGALTGVVWATIRDSQRWKGAEQGLVGGVLMSVGRQTAASPFNGSGFLGREVSAVGVSLVTSTGQRSTTFTFPVGPVSLEFDQHEYDWRLNVTDFLLTIGMTFYPSTRFDVGKSLSSGVPVFRIRRTDFGQIGDLDLTAAQLGGTILLSRNALDSLTGRADAIYHENVHILQEDYFEDAITLPAERAVIRPLPFGRRFLKHLDLGVLGPVLGGQISRLIPYRSRPWEREAYGLTANIKY